MQSSELYIQLMQKVLIDYHRIEKGEYRPLNWGKLNWRQKMLLPLDGLLRTKRYAVCRYIQPDIGKRLAGADWPYYADTMIGYKRLENIRVCLLDILKNNIEGDLIETGAWRGGATIFMRAILKAMNVHDRVVWVADSFEGLPRPNPEMYIHDKGDMHHTEDVLKVTMDEVKHNFEKYDLLDEQVKFLKGWFKDTLPVAPIQKLSILRLDGDMYESTMDALTNLYPKLSKGGYVIIDDYRAIESCRQAVTDYRQEKDILEEIIPVDWSCIYWKKTTM